MATSAEERAISQINNEYKDDALFLENLKALFDNTTLNQNQLKNKLQFAGSEVPGQLESAVIQAEKCTKSISKFSETKEELSGDVTVQCADLCGVTKLLTSLTSQIGQLEKYAAYLSCLRRIDELSSEIQAALLIGSHEGAVTQYEALYDLVQTLQVSSCSNLVTFANGTLKFWYNLLKDKLATEFEEVLSAWRWPFIVTSAKAAKPMANQAEVKDKLPALFTHLLALKLPANLQAELISRNPVLSESERRPLLLPVQLMLKPLAKRFKFHFYGAKQTNSLDKPEWYMTQVLTWLRDHRDFLETRIQPILNSASLPYIDVVTEFTRGLVLLSMEKMLADLPELLFDDSMFCHFIDEVLSFHGELRDAHGYPTSQPSCLRVLTQEKAFEKWMIIERKLAMEKMDSMLSDTGAWESEYSEMGQDIDELRVPQCGESFVTLMVTMTERYRPLPSAWHKHQLLQLQLDILEEYRVRVAQVKNAETTHLPLSSRHVAILNAVSYVLSVLREWADQPFFTELQLFKKKTEEESMYSAPEEPRNEDNNESQMSEVFKKEDLDVADVDYLEGSVFDQLIELYDHFKREMLGNLIKYIVDDVKARSRPYRKDKWLALPSQKEFISLGLSTSACEMLMVLKDHLHHVHGLLAYGLFEETWKKVAADLNTFIYYNVILDNRFNEGGAAQLQFDMTRNLFPLFAQYTTKPANYFKDVKEACVLLTLPSGSAKLLQEVLFTALHEPNTDPRAKVTDPVATLHEMGVYKLDLNNCEWVLKLRTDLG